MISFLLFFMDINLKELIQEIIKEQSQTWVKKVTSGSNQIIAD